MVTGAPTVLAAVLTAAAAGAQPAAPEPGQRVRVTLAPAGQAGPATLVGTLARIDADTLSLRLADGRLETVASGDVGRLERSRGHGSRWRRGLKGAAIGAGLVLAAAAVWGVTSDAPEKDVGAGFWLFLYTPAAARIGLSVGLGLAPPERWERLEPSRPGRATGVGRHAPGGIQVSVRF